MKNDKIHQKAQNLALGGCEKKVLRRTVAKRQRDSLAELASKIGVSAQFFGWGIFWF